MNSAVELLNDSAKKYGEKIAIEDERGSISFLELQQKGKAIGTRLIQASEEKAGVSPVIVYLPKGISCIVSFMGALYSGNPYVPIAADMPASRIQKIIENLEPGHIITDHEGASKLEQCDIAESTAVHIYGDIIETEIGDGLIMKAVDGVIDTDPIYIKYTSGSTGTPKGVVASHRGVMDYADWISETFDISSDSVLGNQAPLYFDNSIFDLYGCLRNGAKMVIIPEALFLFPVKLPEFLQQNEITTIFWVPTVIINVANSGALEKHALPRLKNVLFCGEVMPNRQLNIWRSHLPDRTYGNLYGPTEITDVCTCYIVDREFDDSEPLPIGRACRNTRVVILNEKDEIAGPDERGEICVMGAGVSLGYWNSPELSGRVFVQNPVNRKYHERMYRTGDLAYVNDEGLIMYVGRMDKQIKLKGNRIELGEIENAAVCVDGVENACAILDQQGQKIVLFIEPKLDMTLRKFNLELKKRILGYMLPGELVAMEKLPLTPNGKIDRVLLKSKYI